MRLDNPAINVMRKIADAEIITAEVDTPELPLQRMQLIFDLAYDDEVDDPSQAIRDLLTDVMHIAAHREVNLEEALRRASEMWTMEREDWGLDG